MPSSSAAAHRVSIRDATSADRHALADVFSRSSLSNDGDRPHLLAHPEVLVFDAAWTADSRVRVAVVEGAIVGFATTRPIDEHRVELDDLFVDPDWMRRGVGRALIADAVAAARRAGASRIEVSANVHADSFYRSVGFVSRGIADTTFGPVPRMHLELTSAAPAFDLSALFQRVDRHRVASGQSWAAVSRQTGVSTSTIRRFSTASDAEADGVLALVGWLGALPEEFIVGGDGVGEPLPAADGGFMRVASGRTSIQSLVARARKAGRSIASFTAWRPG